MCNCVEGHSSEKLAAFFYVDLKIPKKYLMFNNMRETTTHIYIHTYGFNFSVFNGEGFASVSKGPQVTLPPSLLWD